MLSNEAGLVLDASDILENKLTQLQSLLSCCYGGGGEWFDAIGAAHRDNIMWIASDLATELTRLSQEILKGNHVMDLSQARGISRRRGCTLDDES